MFHTLYIDLKLYLILIVLIKYAHGICIGTATRTCLEDLDAEETQEKLAYILSKYEEINMKITGEPVGLRGKRITRGEFEELHIVFQLMDNTPYDILQTCDLLLTTAPGQCEYIETVCNTYLPRTPRPLLQRKPLTICEDVVRVTEVETEANAVAATDTEIVTDSDLHRDGA